MKNMPDDLWMFNTAGSIALKATEAIQDILLPFIPLLLGFPQERKYFKEELRSVLGNPFLSLFPNLKT